MKEIENISKILKSISSPIKLRIINIIQENPKSLNEIQEIISKEFKIKYSQTTYKHVENLVQNNLVDKYYDKKQKVIKYKSKFRKIIIDFTKLIIIKN
ncbi:MAG: hypothetical protein ACTSVV_08530 [Promethearchaeota archaeon]